MESEAVTFWEFEPDCVTSLERVTECVVVTLCEVVLDGVRVPAPTAPAVSTGGETGGRQNSTIRKTIILREYNRMKFLGEDFEERNTERHDML